MTPEPVPGCHGNVEGAGGVAKPLSRGGFLGLAGLSLVGAVASGCGLGREAPEALPPQETAPTTTAAAPVRIVGTEETAYLLDELSNSGESFRLPPGDYLVDNSGEGVEIENFGGELIMDPGARFVFLDNRERGLFFFGGTGAVLRGLSCAFEEPPPERVEARECVEIKRAADTRVEGANIEGSAGAGLLFSECVRPSVVGARVKDTMADGLHFANCEDVGVDDLITQNTGDDGLAFLNYSKRDDLSGALARNVRVRNSGARGIAVVGQRDVVVEGFEVDTTHASGVLVAYEPSFESRVPSGVRFSSGTIRYAGRGEKGTGSGSGEGYGIRYADVDSAVFEDIEVISPAADPVSGSGPDDGVLQKDVRTTYALS